MEGVWGWSVLRRARRRAVSQGRCHVLASVSGDVSVPPIARSGIKTTASPSTNVLIPIDNEQFFVRERINKRKNE